MSVFFSVSLFASLSWSGLRHVLCAGRGHVHTSPNFRGGCCCQTQEEGRRKGDLRLNAKLVGGCSLRTEAELRKRKKKVRAGLPGGCFSSNIGYG